MFKKSLASVVSAAVLVAGPGHLTLTAAAQTMTRGPVTGVSVTPAIGNGLNSPVPGASSFNIPTLTPGALAVPGLTDAARLAIPVPMSLAPVAASLAERPLPAAAKALPAAVASSPLAVIKSQDAKVGVTEKGAALNVLFENSRAAAPEALAVLGRDAASVETGLSRAEAASAKSPASVERAALAKGRAAGSLSDLGNLIKRAWNAVLGMLGIGVKKMETPEVMAQRIIDQLNAARPVYNRKVQEASTLVEKLKLQVESETRKVAELEQGITALLSDSDPANDVMASGMINQQKTLAASIAASQEQIAIAEKTLEGIKEERARFFSEREETIAKIQAGLTKSAAADIQKQIAELKGGFQVGDLKDNMDKFEDAVNDKVADAKGTVDSVESNPDQILKKAKDSLKSQEIQDEIAKRKAAIEQAKKEKGQAGGGVIGTMKAVGVAVNVVMAVWAGLNTGWIAMFLGAGAVMGVVMPLGSLGAIALGVFAEKVMKTSGAKTAGMALLGGVVGFGLGVIAVGIGGYVGFAVASPAAAIGLGVTALVTSLLDVAFKSIFKKDKPAAPSADDKGAAGGKLGAIDTGYFSIMGVMMGLIGTTLSAFWPVALAAGLAVGFTALTAKFSRNLAGNGRAYDYTANLLRATAIGMALHAGYALIVGTAFLPALIGAAIVGAAAYWNARKDAAQEAAIEAAKDKGQAGGLILELGIGAAVIAILAAVSAPFRGLLARAWNAVLGMLGLGVKKMETPEVMAQRIIDQLNAQKPVYNRKVQEASTLVEKLRLQIEKQEAQSAELDRSVTAILSDSDPLNDVMAESLLNQKKTVDASTVLTKEQLVLSEKTLVDIKEERARFFSEREEMLAKIQAGLTKSKSAEIQKQIAELKGGFAIGDLKDNMDKFEDAVNDKVADAKGTADSVESNPDQILKKAKDSLKNQEVQDEIAKRKAAIEAAKKAKGSAGGDASQSKALGYFAKAIGIGFALISPWISSAVFALLGLVSIAMAPEQGRWFGRQLAVIGIGTLVIGGAATLLTAKLGLAVGAFGVGLSFVVPAGIALAAGVVAALRAHSKAGGAVAAAAATPAGSSVMTPAPAAAPAEDSAPAVSAPKASFSIKPLLNLISRAWNALLGIFGMGVKKMETPEVMAQRLIDQLNDAKPVYNNKVKEASTLVEALRQQIAGEQAKIAEFDKTITALLSDNDPSNDVQAAGLLNSQKTLEASVAASKEQLAASEKALRNIKEERARFFSEREETLAKIQSGLTKVKAAEIQKQIAELKGGYKIGDLKDNMDRFEGAVDDKVADAKGATDSVESNPDQVLKKAKDSLRTREIADELARRKAAIEQAKKDKGAAGGKLGSYPASIYILGAMGLGVSLAAPASALAVVAVLGLLTLFDNLTAAGNLDKSSKFYAFSIGAGAAALITLGVSGFGVPFYLAGGAAVLANVLGKVHKAIFLKKSAGGDDKPAAGGLILELGVGAAVIAILAAVSAPFRGLLARAWNALLGMIGLGVKKMETPEVMAQRIIDQLNAQKPVYNRKVQEASTLVEKLRLQIEKQEAQSAELDRSVTAILSDSDPLNDVMAESLLNQKKTVDASTAMTKEQLEISEKTLVSIKEERARFFSEREEMLAKIQAGLTKSKSAEIAKQIAELKGGFAIGDLKDNMDKFEDAVNDKVADAKGTADSVESNPDQILKKAKDSLKNQEVQDEIAKRKAAIEAAKKAKGGAAGRKDDSVVNPKSWLYLKIGAALVGFLAALALVPEALIPQALSQIGGALFLSWIFGKSDKKLDAIAFSVAIAAMIAVPLLAPAAMVVTALGAVGTAYFLFLLFA